MPIRLSATTGFTQTLKHTSVEKYTHTEMHKQRNVHLRVISPAFPHGNTHLFSEEQLSLSCEYHYGIISL